MYETTFKERNYILKFKYIEESGVCFERPYMCNKMVQNSNGHPLVTMATQMPVLNARSVQFANVKKHF